MTKLAQVVGGVIAEFPAVDPAILATHPDMTLADCYPAAFIEALVSVDDSAQVGWVTADGGKTFAAPTAPIGPPLASVQASLCADIDGQAEATRLKYITPGSGQMGTYLLKQSQAQLAQSAQTTTDAGKSAAQLAAAYPDLANEIGITVDPAATPPASATDIYGVARAVMAQATVWQPLRLAIERVRLATKLAINTAPTAAAAQSAHDGVTWPSA